MRGKGAPERSFVSHGRFFWAALTAPGIVWLIVLFVVPFYAVVSIAAGKLSPVFQSALPTWNPLKWSGANFATDYHELVGTGAFIGPVFTRTLAYVAIASALSLVIGFPVAYFVTRFSGRRKGFFLALLIAPFWVSYMMRMLAWIDLLQNDGYVNRGLSFFHLSGLEANWLGGRSATVVLGLVYGYIPYLILVLYAGLDRIDSRLIEAGRDLGLNGWRTFFRVTLPMCRQSVMTGLLITVLPMIGDYFTNQMLSGASSTSMIGNVIDGQLNATSLQGQGAALSVLLLIVLLIPMIYYVVSTNRASEAFIS
ncbi:MAG TPA: ABC transporter permease [Acidimicrobiales bacterium]|nr:ABC transporter permease [Acidimicrobiales bacterium]